MSNLEAHPQESSYEGFDAVADEPMREVLIGRDVVLGGVRGFSVSRTLPHKDRRMVGAWCFVDHYGPVDISTSIGMRVPPHPHCGLQTVSWLLQGEVTHRDSLDNWQLITPGQLNLMTAGKGIAHSEESPPNASSMLHGVQLWVALPVQSWDTAPDFEHHPDLPQMTLEDAQLTIIIGEVDGAHSPATTFSPLVGAEVVLSGRTSVPLLSDFEYAILIISGNVTIDGLTLDAGPLVYLGQGRSHLDMSGDATLLLLGGEPFREEIVMWWNFVGRSHEDIVRARQDWEDGNRFGAVQGYRGNRLPAPALPSTTLKPRGRYRYL